MSIVRRSLFATCICVTGLFAYSVYAHTAPYDKTTICTQQSVCEYQEKIVQQIDDVTTPAQLISDQAIKMNIFASLEKVRTLANERYFGKSLMLLTATSRIIYRELTESVLNIVLDDSESRINATTTGAVVLDGSVTSTMYAEAIVEATISSIDIDKSVIILPE